MNDLADRNKDSLASYCMMCLRLDGEISCILAGPFSRQSLSKIHWCRRNDLHRKIGDGRMMNKMMVHRCYFLVYWFEDFDFNALSKYIFLIGPVFARSGKRPGASAVILQKVAGSGKPLWLDLASHTDTRCKLIRKLKRSSINICPLSAISVAGLDTITLNVRQKLLHFQELPTPNWRISLKPNLGSTEKGNPTPVYKENLSSIASSAVTTIHHLSSILDANKAACLPRH
ncbi:hypothetical protein M9H77_08117 [Catharanthus roseus]|uniref:Uncharacterized protein n=1 Tax=Catharanthus roseus TaxID=4058 RepID=A0ACC0BWU3_CATRO|nr:hypothetical protein M9H77_08117 [Catharanthus roseus]